MRNPVINTLLAVTIVLAVLSGILLWLDVPERVCFPEYREIVTRVLALFHVANDIGFIVLYWIKGDRNA